MGQVTSSEWQRLRHRLFSNKVFWLGGVIVLLQILVAVLGPRLLDGDPLAMNVSARLSPPSAEHLMGTDEFGRDLFTRIVHGAPISLRIGAIAVGIALAVGGTAGLISGYFGGWFDLGMMAIVDLMLAFPAILLAMAIVAVLGPGLENTMIAVGIASAPGFARIVRGATLGVRNQVFVESASALGSSDWRVMFRHILPNIAAPLLVLITLEFPAALLSSAGLGFIGLGAQPPDPEWGALLVNARDYLRRAPWMVNFPGLTIMITVLGFNLLGNALRDVLDPTQQPK